MSTLEIQSAIGDTLLQVVLQQQAQAKKNQQLIAKQVADSSMASTNLASKVYAKAA